jgi:hypothetical protein
MNTLNVNTNDILLNSTIHCIFYKINACLEIPFLEFYFEYDVLYNEYYLPFFLFHDNTIDFLEQVKSKFPFKIHWKGFFEYKKEYYILIESEMENEFLLLSDEIINQKVNSIHINHENCELFLQNKHILYVKNECNEYHEIPIVKYSKGEHTFLRFHCLFGNLRLQKEYGNYYYFYDYQNVHQVHHPNQKKKIENGLIRYAIFIKNGYYINNQPLENIKKKIDGLFQENENEKNQVDTIIVKENNNYVYISNQFKNQIPLSFSSSSSFNIFQPNHL